MRLPLLAASLIIALTSIVGPFPLYGQNRLPALKRQPVHGAPLICGRKISQFILLAPVDFTPDDHFSMDRIHGFPKGLFQPASEDADGVFYQAVNGVTVGRPNPPYEHHLTTGGIYVNKTKPGNAYGYIGDARHAEEAITLMSARLVKPVLEKFQIATPSNPGRK